MFLLISTKIMAKIIHESLMLLTWRYLDRKLLQRRWSGPILEGYLTYDIQMIVEEIIN